MNSRDKHEERQRVIAQNGNDGLHYEENKSPEHYDNSKGSLYQFAEDHKLNSWEFDIIKRVIRCRKKGNFIEDIDKTIFLLNLYKQEKGYLHK